MLTENVINKGHLPIPEDGETQNYANRRAVLELARLNYLPPAQYTPLGFWLYSFANRLWLAEFN
jgi:hypothetical protein